MSDLGPGDWVECIDTRGHPQIVSLGALYLVEEAGMHLGYSCLKLKGVVHPHGYRWVLAECFRPIYRRNDSLIQSLKAPAPAKRARQGAPA